jgi:hypothetical protein
MTLIRLTIASDLSEAVSQLMIEFHNDLLGTELSLSSRGRMTLGVGKFSGLFLTLYHNAIPSKGLGIHTYRLLVSEEYARC